LSDTDFCTPHRRDRKDHVVSVASGGPISAGRSLGLRSRPFWTQNALRLAYEGRAVVRDSEAARAWFEKAQANGNTAAANNLRTLK